MNQLPSLNALRAFEVVARHLNFTRAAQELCVTQGAVSRQIKNLENELSTQLFVRIPNHLSLTPEGEILYRGSRDAFRLIMDSRKAIEDKFLKFKILSAPTIATRWLNQRIYRFQEKNPALQIQLETSVKRIDFRIITGFDAAISYGKPSHEANMVFEELMAEFLFPVCSPKLLSENRPIKKISDLSGHCLLHSSLGQDECRAWAEKQRLGDLVGGGDQRFELEESTIQAAKAGAGIALVNLDFIRDEVAAKELLILFPEIPPLCLNSYYLVYPGKEVLNPLLKKFRKWILKERSSFLSNAASV
ncbi:MAG: LysR family transcriptional regulator [Desulfobacterales bacterium]|nr:LysR family transcriptional regulator [Desulfobacterales bacterium]